jgi:ribosome-binding protein aMBF1 (putative translation factor)
MGISRKALDSLPSFEDTKNKVQGDAEFLAEYEQVRAEAAIAEVIREARTHLGLTQKELADRVGTHASVISRIESADYDGHSMKMLYRIAAALSCSIEVSLKPRKSA